MVQSLHPPPPAVFPRVRPVHSCAHYTPLDSRHATSHGASTYFLMRAGTAIGYLDCTFAFGSAAVFGMPSLSIFEAGMCFTWVVRPIFASNLMNGSGSSSSTFTMRLGFQMPFATRIAAATGGTPAV